MYGRKKPYVVASMLLVMSLALTTIPHIGVVRAARFITGMLGMIPGTISCGTFEDVWGIESRNKVITAWTTASNAGLVVGPLLASYVVEKHGW